ncbi:DPP IV N-terminal domain-containing protein [Luteimonas sp. R10]|uniref:S9 family peptidase n=1 Tax=Luteimonas sp. R10 TaxID=3108176 RepID=UPI0030907E93|nr:DPP IV N-terminal domain-containing protein [Luteimonas sp. R10]
MRALHAARRTRRAGAWAAVCLLAIPTYDADAGDMARRYASAATLQDAGALVSRTRLAPRWSRESGTFWYLDRHRGRKTFVFVDPERNLRVPAFDHARLAAALGRAGADRPDPGRLPFDDFVYRDGGTRIGFDSGGRHWLCDLSRYACRHAASPLGAGPGEVLSPDGEYAVFLRGHNLWLREIATGQERALTTDGRDGHGYGNEGFGTSTLSDVKLGRPRPPQVAFSPDSRRLLTYRIDLRPLATLSLLETALGGRPRMHAYRYPVAGDPGVPLVRPAVIDLRDGSRVDAALPPFPQLTSFGMRMCWSPDGSHACFIEEARGYREARLHVMDVATGRTRVGHAERSRTHVDRYPLFALLGDGSRAILSSERDGWKHLYLVDTRSGDVVERITSGAWNVRELLHVDEDARTVHFTAGGREAGIDPYYRQLYRVRLDGSGLVRLTRGDVDHAIAFSPSGRHFIETASRIDAPPVSRLRSADGTLVHELQRADVSRLVEAGWTPPEPFRAKAADGTTDLYGAIFRPSDYSPDRRYPVLDAIYPGPQTIRTVKSFDVERMASERALAELGFIVVTIDGRGTPLRSKEFLDASHGNLGNGGHLEDHIAVLRQLAGRDPAMDLDRVGIYGHSGGGYAAARALLTHPDVYKVAVASAGNHDLRSYWAEWGERFQGYPVDASYAQQANTALASRLRGKLLLVHGTLDDNVHPDATLQLVDALVDANKDFDLLLLPNRNHGLRDLTGGAAGGHQDPYFLRRRWDYFVRNLLGEAPPAGFDLGRALSGSTH